jgi:hypothetical protein
MLGSMVRKYTMFAGFCSALAMPQMTRLISTVKTRLRTLVVFIQFK